LIASAASTDGVHTLHQNGQSSMVNGQEAIDKGGILGR